MSETTKINLVSDLLHRGRERAIPQRDLCELYGCRPAALKRQIRSERLNGSLICADNHGYYLANNSDEVKDFISMLHRQAIARQESLREFRQAVKANTKLAGQMEVDDFLIFSSENSTGGTGK